MKRTPFRLMAVLAAGALMLSACGSDDGGDEGDDAPAADGGGDGGEASEDAGGGEEGGGDGITIGVKIDQPGMGMQDGDTYTGMDTEIAKVVAEKLGYSEDQISFKESVSAQRETMLDTGQVDMIVASYSITDSRKETVQFAGPYFVAGQDLLVGVDSGITGPADLEGKLLCSVAGSTSAENVKADYPDVQLQEYASYSECVEQVANGTLDALTTDDTILAGFAAQEAYAGKLVVAGETFSTENYGIGLNKDDDRCEEINGIITEMWEDGTMEEIIDEFLGAANYTPNAEANPPEAGGNCA
ncbi:glutamate ABC transporter substrate-binding protein [Ornithinimicrobium faecis]|uniref:glutamate ABC transporter substrate-binding protein n=1 Tax=Ornithinimicrobium faecis TaxID=2934158 RepID=UPI00211824A8|nr:glutamate ABC transporter substrate-binding protein [Ornithinimicrobium sp. HY1745]